VTIVELGDFECPVCRSFHADVRTVREQFPLDVSLVFVHFPLSIHRFAIPAAKAAECAYEQGKFAPFHELLFDKQDSLGLKPWTSYALEAGVEDSAEFSACVSSNRQFPRIEAGIAAAREIKARGTPTIFLNGWRLFHTPSATELSEIVRALLAGRSPGSPKAARP
jgi:protein-disulfide isomerase